MVGAGGGKVGNKLLENEGLGSLSIQILDIADKGEYGEYIARMLQLIIDQIRSYGRNKKQ